MDRRQHWVEWSKALINYLHKIVSDGETIIIEDTVAVNPFIMSFRNKFHIGGEFNLPSWEIQDLKLQDKSIISQVQNISYLVVMKKMPLDQKWLQIKWIYMAQFCIYANTKLESRASITWFMHNSILHWGLIRHYTIKPISKLNELRIY